MYEITGWLLDVYPHPVHGHLTVWIIADDGRRYRLQHRFPVTFFAGGAHQRLRELGVHLKRRWPHWVSLKRTERRLLLEPDPLTVMEIQILEAARFPRIMREIEKPFVDVDFYDNDIRLQTRYAAAFDVFPMTRCRVAVSGGDAVTAEDRVVYGGWIESIEPLGSRWDVDPPLAPLRVLGLAPNSDPFHAQPQSLKIAFEEQRFQIPLADEDLLLDFIVRMLNEMDPDIIVSRHGDDWVLPYLISLAQRRKVYLPLNRDPDLEVTRRDGGVHFTYGQVIRRGPQSLLHGRLHLDARNTLSIGDVHLEGVIETARIGGLPIQTAARTSPGATLTSMKMITYLRRELMVPNFKQQTEDEKDILSLVHSDKGGLIFTPVPGLHKDVIEVDFTSMFPWIARRYDISPETVDRPHLKVRDPRHHPPPLALSADLDTDGETDPAAIDLPTDVPTTGILAETLTPLLEKRFYYKQTVSEMTTDHPQYELFKNRLGAHKDIGVVAYGRTKFRKETDGKVEVHEGITDFARKSLILAKMEAEALGFEFLHGYVDSLYLHKAGGSTQAEIQQLLDAIIRVTGLPIVLEGQYKWMAFMPSKRKPRVPVANRFFGLDVRGEFKVRGLASRRKDTPAWIAQGETELLAVLRQTEVEDLPTCLPEAVACLRAHIQSLRVGQVPLDDLVLTKKLTKAPEEYRANTDTVRVAKQLIAADKLARIGDHMHFVYVLGPEKVYGWDLPIPPDRRAIDIARYQELLLRNVHMILQMLGVSESDLKRWVLGPAGMPVQAEFFQRLSPLYLPSASP